MIHGKVNEIAVTPGSTLRETLSRMLSRGFKHIPVIDEQGRLLGEVRLSDIESVTTEMET